MGRGWTIEERNFKNMKSIVLVRLKELFCWWRAEAMDISRMTLKLLMQREREIEVTEEDSTSVFLGGWCRA